MSYDIENPAELRGEIMRLEQIIRVGKQCEKMERERAARNAAYAEARLEWMGKLLAALNYWMPDETLVKPEEEAAWDKDIKLCQSVAAILDHPAALAKNPGGTQPATEEGGNSSGGAAKPSSEIEPLTVSRTDADYAIEHAGYFLDAFRHYENAHEAAAVASDDYEDEKIDFDAYERAYAAEAEAMGKLRDLAYEFEKRRDRALATVAPRVEGR